MAAEEQYAAYNDKFGYPPKEPKHLIAFANKNNVKVSYTQANKLIQKAPNNRQPNNGNRQTNYHKKVNSEHEGADSHNNDNNVSIDDSKQNNRKNVSVEYKDVEGQSDTTAQAQRLVSTLSHYNSLMKQHKIDNKFMEKVNVLQTVHNFQHLVAQENNSQQIEGLMNTLGPCEISAYPRDCRVFKRHYRDRSISLNNNEIVKLYGVGSNVTNTKYIARCEMFDKIHVFSQHSIDIGNILSIKDEHVINAVVANENDSDISMTNVRWVKLRNQLSEKQILPKDILHVKKQRMFNKFNQNMLESGWEFRYEMEEEKHIIFQDPLENEHRKCAVIVHPKHPNLKEELIENSISTISKLQYECELEKAKIHCNTEYRKKSYNGLSEQHILSLMIYCNYDQLQNKFSNTYREQDCLSHSNFYHLGKLLRQSVLNFGKTIRDRKVKVFYHGIRERLVPPEIVGYLGKGIKMYCPLSTSSSLAVAANFTDNSQGLIMQFGGDRSRAKSFSVSWLSDFANESEYLFLQNKDEFQINNIIECDKGCECEFLLNALKTMDAIMSIDYFQNDCTVNVKNSMVPLIIKIIEQQLSVQLPNENWNSFDSLTKEGKRLVYVYFNNLKQLSINYTVLEYNYESLFKLFCLSEYEWIHTARLRALFPNLSSIRIRNITLCSEALENLIQDLNKDNNSWKRNKIQIVIKTREKTDDLSVYKSQCKQIKKLGLDLWRTQF